MKKIFKDSRMCLKRADRFDVDGDIIIQCKNKPEYKNNAYNVYLCECMDKEKYLSVKDNNNALLRMEW